jgi:hypothetical protein
MGTQKNNERKEHDERKIEFVLRVLIFSAFPVSSPISHGKIVPSYSWCHSTRTLFDLDGFDFVDFSILLCKKLKSHHGGLVGSLF